MIRLVVFVFLSLPVLAPAAAAQEGAVSELFTYRRDVPGLARVQVAQARGCRLEILVETAIPGAPGPQRRELTRLWLADWRIVGLVGPDGLGDAGILLRLLIDDPQVERQAYLDARRQLRDLDRMLDDGFATLDEVLEEREALIREIATEGLAGSYGTIAARNNLETAEFLPGGRRVLDWEPVTAVVIDLPEERLGDGVTALAVMQETGCF